MSCRRPRCLSLAATAAVIALLGCGKRPISDRDDGAVRIDAGVPDTAPPIDAAVAEDVPALADAGTADGATPEIDAAGPCRVTTADGGTVACTEMLVGFELENSYCGMKPGGELRCWSNQDFFTNMLASLVAKAPPGLVQIAAADSTQSDPLFCGLDAQGNGTCWGATTNMNMGGGLTSVVVSRYGTCALHMDGHMTCTAGLHALPSTHRYTQLAVVADFLIGLDDTGTPITSQVDLTAPPGVYRRVATLSAMSAALRDDGTLFLLTWQQAMAMPGAFVELSLDMRRLCGIDHAGEVTCFPLGAGGPTPPTPAAGPFIRIVGGDSTMCGLRPTGTTTCWGDVPVAVPDGW